MSAATLPPKPSGTRPPTDGGIRTGYGFGGDDPENEALQMLAFQVGLLESWAKSAGSSDTQAILDLIDQRRKWIESELRWERAVQPHLLPPGIGALHSIDYLLEPESEFVAKLQRLLVRLEVLETTVRRRIRESAPFPELNFERDWGLEPNV